MKDKILIGVSILEPNHKFYLGFINFQREILLCKERPFSVGFNFTYRTPIHLAQEQHAHMALMTGCTHLLLMDDDIYNPSLMNLQRLYQANKDVVGGAMYSSKWPHSLCAFRRMDANKRLREYGVDDHDPFPLYSVPDDQQQGVVAVELIPFGFILIRTSIFQNIQPPWFGTGKDNLTDSWFADLVLEANLEYYVHFGVWLNHFGITKENKDLWIKMGDLESKPDDKQKVMKCDPGEREKWDKLFRQKLERADIEFRKRKAERVEETFV